VKHLYKLSTLVFVLLFSCGKVPVEIDHNTYNAKIVVDGYIFAGEKPSTIRITRNYALNQQIDFQDFILTDAQVSIEHVDENKIYELYFNPATLAFEYFGDDLIIQPGHTYTLHVTAEVEGEMLETWSTTVVPESGFQINEVASRLGQTSYKQAVSSNEKFSIAFHRSPNCASYIGSIQALDASLDNFIQDNILGLDSDMIDDSTDMDELQDFNFLKYQSQWLQTQADGTRDISYFDVEWFSTWFYGHYEVVLYAADKNYTEYYLTHNSVMEIDGNLIEPRFNFQGDGIGVFGSAIRDTAYFEILP